MKNIYGLVLGVIILSLLLQVNIISASEYGYDSKQLTGGIGTSTSTTVVINGSASGTCPAGYAVQNLTGTGLQCVVMPGVGSYYPISNPDNYVNQTTVSIVNTSYYLTSNPNNYVNGTYTNFSSFNATQMQYSGGFVNILESWLTSFGNTVWCKLTGCTISGNLNVTGNVTINNYYGEMWFNNDSTSGKTTIISSTGVWINISGFEQTEQSGGTNNGFSKINGNALQSQVAGLYKIYYSISYESAGTSKEYETAIAVNGIIQNNTESHTTRANPNEPTGVGQSGFIRLNTNDLVYLQIKQITATGTNIGSHSGNVNLIRIGN